MNIHEYQAKQLLQSYGIPIPNGQTAFTVEEALTAAKNLYPSSKKDPLWVVKAQIHAGGRGRAGGIKLAHTLEEVETYAREIFGKFLITPQTGPDGKCVKCLYIEEGVEILQELYLSILLDRRSGRISLIVCSKGGGDIEEIALKAPQQIYRISIDPAMGFQAFHGRKLLEFLKIKGDLKIPFQKVLENLYKAYVDLDATLIEINPLCITKQGTVFAVDLKISLDDNALFRHPKFLSLLDPNEEDPIEMTAAHYGLNYVKLSGNIGCMVNGAGLAMATMDIIKLHGGKAANFLDVGGGATQEMVSAAFKIIMSDRDVKGILVNIFGGIMRCDMIAAGIVVAAQEHNVNLPLVVRLQGTNAEEGKQVLESSHLKIQVADTLEDAAHLIVSTVKSS